MNDCVFCKIIKKEINSHIVYEDKEVIAFLDVNPVNKGHVLVIPKKHYQWMYDVPDKLLGIVFDRTKLIMKSVKRAMKADYVAISVVGTDIPHFHVHIIPRYHNDGLANFWPTKKFGEEEMLGTRDKIKSYLK